MKVFDATTVIAFLSEMQCPDSLQELSKYYQLLIPHGVYAEITKPPGKQMLDMLVKKQTIQIVEVDQNKAAQLQKEYPQLGRGECEAILLAMSSNDTSTTYILSDDLKARKIFQSFNFRWTQELLKFMKTKNMIKSEMYEIKLERLRKSNFFFRGKRV